MIKNKKSKQKIKGTKDRPRLSVFRSNRLIWAQIIDDQAGKTLAAAWEKEVGKSFKGSKTEKAAKTGELLAQKATKKKVKKVVFDRGRRPYHGRIKALADGARKGGLKF